MARALKDIITELNSVYNPQRDLYNTQISQIDPMMQAEEKGLEAQKQDSFGQITQGANRRGLLFSGIPLAEQANYVGTSFLPAVANLKSKYAQQRFNLQDALAKIVQDQYKSAYDIYRDELAADEARRARASSGSGGGFVPGGRGSTSGGAGELAPQLTLREQWQKEANAGDWDAQVALNYAGDDGRYDGPVNSVDEFNRLRNMGIVGNYYVANRRGSGGGGGGGGGGGF